MAFGMEDDTHFGDGVVANQMGIEIYEVWLERGRFGVSGFVLIIGLIIYRLNISLKICEHPNNSGRSTSFRVINTLGGKLLLVR